MGRWNRRAALGPALLVIVCGVTAGCQTPRHVYEPACGWESSGSWEPPAPGEGDSQRIRGPGSFAKGVVNMVGVPFLAAGFLCFTVGDLLCPLYPGPPE